MNNLEKVNKVLNQNKTYISQAMADRMFESEYNTQAINFLLETETTCKIEFRGLARPPWNKDNEVNSYRVTLKNKKHTYEFEFFDSISNTEKGKKATYDFYSVLACLDINIPENFDDFISEFGYEFSSEAEYIRVKAVHLACLDQAKNLRKLFNEEQLEKLSEIR